MRSSPKTAGCFIRSIIQESLAIISRSATHKKVDSKPEEPDAKTVSKPRRKRPIPNASCLLLMELFRKDVNNVRKFISVPSYV